MNPLVCEVDDAADADMARATKVVQVIRRVIELECTVGDWGTISRVAYIASLPAFARDLPDLEAALAPEARPFLRRLVQMAHKTREILSASPGGEADWRDFIEQL